MKLQLAGLALVLGLAACGSGEAPFGNPDTGGGGETPGDGTAPIPDELAGTLQSFSYDPANQTLSIRGIVGDNNAIDGAYRRRPALDRGGYEAYTAQDASNGRHSTVYVRDINGTRAAVVATGGQYENIYAGGAYSNTSYSPRVAPGSTDPDSGLVYYTGRYVGLLNGPGSNEDVTPPNPDEDPSVLTRQAAEVTGDMQMTADFATAQVGGIIYNRVVADYNSDGRYDPNSADPLLATDVALEGTGINADGTFLGTAEQNNQSVGEYGGIFGGTGATEVAGVVHVENHIAQVNNEIEHGVFVLSECTPPLSGPECNLAPATP